MEETLAKISSTSFQQVGISWSGAQGLKIFSGLHAQTTSSPKTSPSRTVTENRGVADAHARIRNAFLTPRLKHDLAAQAFAVGQAFAQDGERSNQIDWFEFAQQFSTNNHDSDYNDYNYGDYEYGDYDFESFVPFPTGNPISTTNRPITSKPSIPPPGTGTCSIDSHPKCEKHFGMYPPVNGWCRRFTNDNLGKGFRWNKIRLFNEKL